MSSDIRDSTFRKYEEYVLSGKKVEDTLKNLVEGSNYYNYLKALDLLTKKKLALTPEDKDFVESYITTSKTSESEKIKLRYNLLKYDEAKSEIEKQEALEVIAKKDLNLHFEYNRPADIGMKQEIVDSDGSGGSEKEGEEEKTKKTVVAAGEALLNEVDAKEQMEKLYNKEIRATDLSKKLLTKINFEKIPKDIYDSVMDAFGTDLMMVTDMKMLKCYAKYLREGCAVNKSFNLDRRILNNMTLDQLDSLKSLVSGIETDVTFLQAYIAKYFANELSAELNSHLSEEERRENLIKIYTTAKVLPFYLTEFKSSVLLEILENGIKLDIYSKEYFLEYLKNPIRGTCFKNAINYKSSAWDYQLRNVKASISSGSSSLQSGYYDKDLKLLEAYITHFIKNGEKVDAFLEYIQESVFNQIRDAALLTSGQKVEITVDNAGRMEKLGRDVSIEICPKNKEVFQLNEDISLLVELKNVPTLFIKVFEINTENYYRKNFAPFKTDINLDGLVAAIEKSLDYKQRPQIKFRETLNFPELKGKTGLFVIELIGNGKSSRAIIKVGTLSVIASPKVYGQECYILDGERKKCCAESTGIFMDNQLFKADLSSKGKIIIPYLPNGGSKNSQAILLHNGMAQLVEFTRLDESYSLNCSFCMFPESYIMGQKATILIRPRLFINGRRANLSLLQNITCVVCSSSYIDDIPVTETYKNLKVDENKELTINFQAVAQIKSLEINFSAQVKSESKNKEETLQASHRFIVDNHVSDKSIYELYLRMNKDLYELHVLGKNGEPAANVPVSFQFASNLFQFVIHKDANTNDKGIIKLGKLSEIRAVRTQIQQAMQHQTISKEWIIPRRTIFDYPASIDIIENEVILLPIPCDNIEDPVYLQSISPEGEVLKNCSKMIQLDLKKGRLYGELKIEKLTAGNYVLWGLSEGMHIPITVHKGVYWPENPNYILKQFSLIEKISHDLNATIKINTVDIVGDESKKVTMSIDVAPSSSNKWRVHVLLFQFLPGNVNEMIARLKSPAQERIIQTNFQAWTNFFLSNRELSTEFRYCFDRKQMPRFTGNTLEKPRLLLKRALVQTTETQKGYMKEGTAYGVKAEEACRMARKCMDARYDRMEGYGGEHASSIGRNASLDMINLFQNFIAREPKILYNIPGNSANKIVVELEKEFLENYASMLILAVDDTSATHYLQSLAGLKIEKRDITLKKPLSSEKMYAEMRTAKCVEKYQSHIIDDITSKDRLIVDSLDKVFMVEKELMRSKGYSMGELDSIGDTVMKWETTTEDEKNKILSKYSCHELHLFIMKKDKDYFDKIVKPYLVNKMEKTSMDHYLLNDIPAMLSVSEKPALFAQLNALEKALYVEAFTLSNHKDIAEKIARSMREDVNSIKKSVRDQNRIFDTVLGLNMLKANKEGIESDLLKTVPQEESKFLPPPAVAYAAAPMEAKMRFCGRGRGVANKISVGNRKRSDSSDSVGAPEGGASDNSDMDERQMRRKASETCLPEKAKEEEERTEHQSEKKKKQAPRQAAPKDTVDAKEYAEGNYYGNAQDLIFTYQVHDCEFWVAYAEHVLKNGLAKAFISTAFIETFQNLTEVVASLALLSLPFFPMEHGFKTLEGRAAELKATTNLMIFQKEVKESQGEIQSNILVAQRYVDPMHSAEEGDEKIEEFLVNKIYNVEVIVTNISSRTLEFNVLWQIPEGAVPVGNSSYQKSESLSLNSYSTVKREYSFYFPAPGKFEHFPPNVAVNSKVVAKAAKSVLTVVKQKSKISETNFQEVLSTLDKTLILNFLKERPIKTIKEFSWSSIYWLLSDKAFYKAFLDLLRQQKRFDTTAWSFSLYHKDDEKAIKEYLESQSYYQSRLGFSFASKLLTVNPLSSYFRHLDYYPLVNPRAHKIEIISDDGGSERPLILNYNFYETYKKFIFYMMEKETWDVQDKMSLTYYLLLQERVQEGLKVYSTIKPEVDMTGLGSLRLQYDYMTAFLDFYTGAPDFKKARTIAAKYLNYPVISWRFLFMDVQNQLDEYDGKRGSEMAMIQSVKKDEDTEKKTQVITQPKLGLALEGKTLVVDYQNLQELSLKYYIIDLEILFCRSPFLAQNTEDFSYVNANMTESLKLDPKACEFRVKIPEKYLMKNIVIEANGGGINSLVTYFSTSLKVNIFENYGELKVTDENAKGLPQVYVKIYAKMKNGSLTFYKDGYTDIRGRFDYVSHNASKLTEVAKFAIFVSSEIFGSLIRETVPPPVVTKSEDEFGCANKRYAGYLKEMECKPSFSK